MSREGTWLSQVRVRPLHRAPRTSSTHRLWVEWAGPGTAWGPGVAAATCGRRPPSGAWTIKGWLFRKCAAGHRVAPHPKVHSLFGQNSGAVSLEGFQAAGVSLCPVCSGGGPCRVSVSPAGAQMRGWRGVRRAGRAHWSGQASTAGLHRWHSVPVLLLMAV